MDPLEKLQDIQLPNQIHNYPIAIGWWILVVIVAVVIFFIVAKIIKAKKAAKNQSLAINQLNSNEPDIDNSITILKWAALQYFSRSEVANLYGNHLKTFLVTQLPEKHKHEFNQLCANTLENRYQNTIDNESVKNFHKASLLWLKQALPPKNSHELLTTESTEVNS